MDFSLSSSLVGSAVSNPDKLALDLQFATDKTLTARKGPTPTFTRASSGTFVGSDGLIQSAGNNVARFDHDPITLACRGLLIEESRTNLVIQSEDFGTSWSTDAGKVAVSTNVIASPSGVITADKITENSILLERKILIGSVTAVAATVYTFSCYLKAGERNFAQLAFGATFGSQFQNFIIGGVNAGTLGSGSGVTSPQITALPNGWYRCTATITSAGSGSTQVTIGPLDSSTASRWAAYMGTVGSGIYAWGAQVEAGLFPTSYIPTTTTSVIRSADVCSITGGNFSGFYNPLEGTMVTASSINGLSSIITNVASIESGTTIVIRTHYRVAQSNRLSVAVSGVTATPASNYNTANVVYMAAIAADATGADYVIDGTQITDVFTGSALTADNLKFTGSSASTSNNTISSLRYYKKRLPVEKLQTITV